MSLIATHSSPPGLPCLPTCHGLGLGDPPLLQGLVLGDIVAQPELPAGQRRAEVSGHSLPDLTSGCSGQREPSWGLDPVSELCALPPASRCWAGASRPGPSEPAGSPRLRWWLQTQHKPGWGQSSGLGCAEGEAGAAPDPHVLLLWMFPDTSSCRGRSVGAGGGWQGLQEWARAAARTGQPRSMRRP